MSKKLSILICSTYDRDKQLNDLLKELNAQKTDEVEILTEIDQGYKKGGLFIGEKRNLLLKKATGIFSAFIDSDDKVSHDYVSKILKAIETDPDCIGIEGLITIDGKSPPKKFIHSLKVKEWYEKDKIYYRSPNHLNPIKKFLALQVGFENRLNHGEDHDFSKRILPLLKKEVFIDGPIYYYLFSSKKKG